MAILLIRTWILLLRTLSVNASFSFFTRQHQQHAYQKHLFANLRQPNRYSRAAARGWLGSSLTLRAATVASATEVPPVEPSNVIVECPILGKIYPIRVPGRESFVSAMAVPTFASFLGGRPDANQYSDYSSPVDAALQPAATLARDLQHALGQGPAIYLHSVLSADACNHLIGTCETLGFGSFRAGKNHHGALQIVVPQAVCDAVADTIRPFINVAQVNDRRREMNRSTSTTSNGSHCLEKNGNDEDMLFATSLNRRWRVYRYEPGGEQTFSPHIDAGFPPSGLDRNGQELVWDSSSGTAVSRLTVLMYLNEDFVGGETNFFQPAAAYSNQAGEQHDDNERRGMATETSTRMIASVRPVTGACLCFPQACGEEAVDYARQHWPLHEGSPVESGSRPKYVIRSDFLFSNSTGL